MAMRPTAGRVREALFDALEHNPAFVDTPLAGACVLDAFAGSGALGLEALSRGAGFVHFIDNDRRAIAAVRDNLAALGAGAQAAPHWRDATDPGPAPAAAAIAFLDPPYGAGLAAPALAALAAACWLAPGAVVAVERGARDSVETPAGFAAVSSRRYGRGAIDFLRRTGSA